MEISLGAGRSSGAGTERAFGRAAGLNDGGVRPAVILDMSGVRPGGAARFAISDGNVKLARGVRLVRAIPSEMRYRVRAEGGATVPVTRRFTGEGRERVRGGAVAVGPPTLPMCGPASQVARIQEVITDPVDVSNVVGTSEFRVNAYMDDPYVRLQGSPQVAVTVTMKKK